MTRIFYNFQDFRLRLDDGSPVHYDILLEKKDSTGSKWVSTYRIFGVDRRGTRIVFEQKWHHSIVEAMLRPYMSEKFIATYARPLNATAGRIELETSEKKADSKEYSLEHYDFSREPVSS